MVGRTVQRVFSDRGFCYYQSRWVFIATWHNVSRYTSITARNTVRVNCQLISSKVAFSEPMSVITSLQNCNSIICRSDNQIGVAFAAVATALHCERSCAVENVSVRDMTLSKEIWSSQLVLGRPPDDSRKGRGMSISGCAADSNITPEFVTYLLHCFFQHCLSTESE